MITYSDLPPLVIEALEAIRAKYQQSGRYEVLVVSEWTFNDWQHVVTYIYKYGNLSPALQIELMPYVFGNG